MRVLRLKIMFGNLRDALPEPLTGSRDAFTYSRLNSSHEVATQTRMPVNTGKSNKTRDPSSQTTLEICLKPHHVPLLGILLYIFYPRDHLNLSQRYLLHVFRLLINEMSEVRCVGYLSNNFPIINYDRSRVRDLTSSCSPSSVWGNNLRSTACS